MELYMLGKKGSVYIGGEIMEVSADKVIDNLCEQIKQMAKALAVKDAQIELLQQKAAKQSTDK